MLWVGEERVKQTSLKPLSLVMEAKSKYNEVVTVIRWTSVESEIKPKRKSGIGKKIQGVEVREIEKTKLRI